MKVTIITVCYNSEETIEETIKSIKDQTYSNIEYIVIDGASTDGTLEIINKHQKSIDVLCSERDNGIYDAMNKGIALATGDIVGFLNADDVLAHSDVITTIVDVFHKSNHDAVYADLVYFQLNEGIKKTIRYFKSKPYRTGLFAKGWCPPHPTFYVKRKIYQTYGSFNLNLDMGNDVELMMRLLEKEKISVEYIPQVLVKMRLGGVSNQSVRNIWQQNKTILQAAKNLNIAMPLIPFVFFKIIDRLNQFIRRPSQTSI